MNPKCGLYVECVGNRHDSMYSISLLNFTQPPDSQECIYICRNFVTHALFEFGEACAVTKEYIITPLVHVVLWTKAQNSSYIHYNTPRSIKNS